MPLGTIGDGITCRFTGEAEMSRATILPIRMLTPWADGIFPKFSLMGPLNNSPVVRAERREGTRNEAAKWQ